MPLTVTWSAAPPSEGFLFHRPDPNTVRSRLSATGESGQTDISATFVPAAEGTVRVQGPFARLSDWEVLKVVAVGYRDRREPLVAAVDYSRANDLDCRRASVDEKRFVVRADEKLSAVLEMTTAESLVFLIDDDASVRKGVARLLRTAGYESEIFASASDFLPVHHTAALRA